MCHACERSKNYQTFPPIVDFMMQNIFWNLYLKTFCIDVSSQYFPYETIMYCALLSVLCFSTLTNLTGTLTVNPNLNLSLHFSYRTTMLLSCSRVQEGNEFKREMNTCSHQYCTCCVLLTTSFKQAQQITMWRNSQSLNDTGQT